MTKPKKFNLISLITLLVATMCFSLIGTGVHADISNKYVHSTTPTLFFHGYGSGAHAEEYMVNGFVKAGVSKTVITADVASNGTVTLKGKIAHNAINPLVMVNFDNSRTTDYVLQGQWVKNVLEELQAQYHFKKVNIEAHSMGNMAVMYYLLANAGNHNLPQIQKQVAMAGTFDGAIGWNEPANLTTNKKTGKPSSMNDTYQKLLPLRHRYPTQIKLLNIYGDLKDGNDSQVSNASCQSLKYLVNNRTRSYREIKITGPDAKHELLHRSPQVNKILIKFFWGK
ncbi:alpha/beta hydrolase [Limosilactobacillus albertensis]|uniref:Alpha/beta hydrolase n=1 Tax=Limosilactobacillus albertensis TaxID=2759752 RepID=A0A839H485_9LACO|nr:alpha/beta hydrolase [Limosilactobacillus albertensis]MBB1123300.1 alpha/beta hydrolase [Limosilactobacillus albertensis]MCD7121288.1 alpha/beta hydrolase [Limosilactobacillus albertensis]